jgi:hypothetical protein
MDWENGKRHMENALSCRWSCAKLWALVDLAARAGEKAVARGAARHLRAIGEPGDLHAVPT